MDAHAIANDLILKAVADCTRMRMDAEERIALHEGHVAAARNLIVEIEGRRANLVASMRALGKPPAEIFLSDEDRANIMLQAPGSVLMRTG